MCVQEYITNPKPSFLFRGRVRGWAGTGVTRDSGLQPAALHRSAALQGAGSIRVAAATVAGAFPFGSAAAWPLRGGGRSSGLQGALAREDWAGVRARAVARPSVGARVAVLSESDSACDAGAFLPLPLPPRPRLPSLRPSPAAEEPPPAAPSCRPPPGPLTRPPAPGCRPSSAA